MKNEKAEVRHERAREKGKRDAAGNHSYICGLCIQGFAVSGRMSAFGDEPDGQIGGDLLYLTPSSYIRELTARYQVPLYVRDGASNIREDWMFAYGKAQGRFVTIAHQDDRYRSDYAEKLLKEWKKYPDLLLFASDYLTIRMTEKEGKMRAIPEPFNMVWLVKKILRLPLRFHFLADRTWIKRSSVWFGNSICCPSCTYNKEQIGDDMFHSKYDFALDWDNLYELAGKKGRFICSEKPLIAYRVHAAATTKACIEDNRRPADEMAMFRKMWPDWMVKILMHFYRKAYKEYEK